MSRTQKQVQREANFVKQINWTKNKGNMELYNNTPRTRVGPGFRHQTLAVKSNNKKPENQLPYIFLLVGLKYKGP